MSKKELKNSKDSKDDVKEKSEETEPKPSFMDRFFADSAAPWKLATALMLVLFVGSIFTGGFGIKVPTGMFTASEVVEPSIIDSAYNVKGVDDAQVEVTVCSEYLCPYCAIAEGYMDHNDPSYEPAVPNLIENYVETGKATFTFKNFIVHGEKAIVAAEAAECAGIQGKFWEMHEAIFKNQQATDRANLDVYAEEIELDIEKFSACMDTQETRPLVDAQSEWCRSKGVTGTPTFFVGDEMLVGAKPYSDIKAAIDRALGGETAPEDPEITLTVIADKGCTSAQCDTQGLIDTTTTELFPTAKVVELDKSDAEAKALIAQLDITGLPAYIFSSNVVDAEKYEQVAGALVKSGDYYYIHPQATGIGVLLNKPEIEDDELLGDPDAPVSMIVFSEYECPYCGAFEGSNDALIEMFKEGNPEYEPAFPKIKEEYIDTGKVNYIFKHYPLDFHANARKASEAAECAGEQGKFWEMHEILFEKMSEYSEKQAKYQETQDEADAPGMHPFDWHFLENHAKDAGVEDLDAFSACLGGEGESATAAEIDKDLTDAEELGVSGTPTIFVNDKIVSGSVPFSEIQKIIEAELASAS